jgi:hypothetical protein
MQAGAAILLFAVFLTACTQPLPIQPDSPSAEACPAALLEGELLPDDADGFLVRHESGAVTAVVWPDGYSVRDAEVRELLDPDGRVVARERQFVSLGGGMTADDSAFVVCGPFTVTPAR